MVGTINPAKRNVWLLNPKIDVGLSNPNMFCICFEFLGSAMAIGTALHGLTIPNNTKQVKLFWINQVNKHGSPKYTKPYCFDLPIHKTKLL